MHGNVFEWCWDYFEPYTAIPMKTDPVGTESTPDYTDKRVLRNGSWNQPAANLRSAYRTNSTPYNLNNMIGFRVIRPAE
jgi:formylglycine-generating enzyme required for sulfatase activity